MGFSEPVVPRVSAQDSSEEDLGRLATQEPQVPMSGKWEGESRRGSRKKGKWWRRKRDEVALEGHVGEREEDEEEEKEDEVEKEEEKQGIVGIKDFRRTKSLTDVDLHELKGCLDLGFGFSYEEIPELCNTLPALELCYSMSQRFLDEQRQPSSSGSSSAASSDAGSAVGSPIAHWRISSPGDRPEDVKARLKFWAQAVACTIRLCS
ncbi:hypothetical protein EJ110_NYTH29471 [Nymphaea thermarum]|nr:hypothetical protein EJ110_NYTH29471 [Nymphaea thermarum]